MNQSVMTGNLCLEKAYRHFQNGQAEQALTEYQKALKSTYPQDLKANIRCTIAIIEQSQGNYSRATEILGSIASTKTSSINSMAMVRIYANMTMFQILEGNFTQALQHFESILSLFRKQKDSNYQLQLLKFTTYLFFRVNNLNDINEQIENMDVRGMRIEELYCLSLMAFSSQLCRINVQQKVQRMCYQEFMKMNRYDLAMFSLRSLIFFTKNMVNRANYEKQLAKLVMMGVFSDSIDFQNYEPFEVIQAIMQHFLILHSRIHEQLSHDPSRQSHFDYCKKNESNESELMVQWKYAIMLIKKELKRSKQMERSSKDMIQMLQTMKDEKNAMILRQLVKNNYFYKYYDRVKKGIKAIPLFLTEQMNQRFKLAFQKIIKHVVVVENIVHRQLKESNIDHHTSIKSERTKSIVRSKEEKDKENNSSLGISIISISSSKVSLGRKKIFDEHNIQQANRRIMKMVRVCECGGFLNKRNFNSEGGQFKFVKINNNFIKWAKDPQQIDTNYHLYPLKDIKSIIFGRVSPNLNENWNKMLKYDNCFSLLLNKRTLDFYCKSYQEVEAWVCGLTKVLKKDGNKIVGYTPGKLRWKKMFAILRENFTDSLKVTERHKYYYQNAYALKLFAANGYQLPSKSTAKR